MINKFQGEYRWLSNFWSCFITFEGLEYPSVENAYQAAKTLDIDSRKIFQRLFPGAAKKKSKDINLRGDWEDVKFLIMEDLIRQKFTKNLELKQKLLETGDQELIEGNNWGDTYWGVSGGVGQNNLGKIIMKIRGELNELYNCK